MTTPIDKTGPVALLTFALEYMGQKGEEYEDDHIVFLTRCLRHEHSLVREGAVYGLEGFIGNPKAAKAPRERLEIEDSKGVKQALEDAVFMIDEEE